MLMSLLYLTNYQVFLPDVAVLNSHLMFSRVIQYNFLVKCVKSKIWEIR